MIYLTGFEAFAHFEENPTKKLVTAVDRKGVQASVLPVEYERAFATMKQTKPGLSKTIIHFGVSDRAPRWQLEYYAHNLRHCPTEGRVAERIREEGPEVIKTSAPVVDWLNRLNEKDPGSTELSTSAGTYVCNDLYYLSLLQYSSESEILFIHVPDFGTDENHNFERQSRRLAHLLQIISDK